MIENGLRFLLQLLWGLEMCKNDWEIMRCSCGNQKSLDLNCVQTEVFRSWCFEPVENSSSSSHLRIHGAPAKYALFINRGLGGVRFSKSLSTAGLLGHVCQVDLAVALHDFLNLESRDSIPEFSTVAKRHVAHLVYIGFWINIYSRIAVQLCY